ncbi:hypothetical protein ACFSR7_36230 [Cohnella sp. GCM10020058]|uniref:hypothetical protein n=1 Tax=Cohnella sp. GCM10020058 TaxID=3317330 RepID=UPI00362BDE25
MDEFSIDIADVFKGMDFAGDRAMQGAERGMTLIMEDLKEESNRRAPKLTGNLRSHVSIAVTTSRGRVVGTVSYRAISTSKSGWGYDYALHLHEMPKIKDPTTPGTGPKFLSRPLKARSAKYEQMLAQEIAKELR